MGNRPVVAVDARRSGGSGIGRYTQCVVEAFQLCESLRDRFTLVELVGGDTALGSSKVRWSAPLLSPRRSSGLERLLDSVDADLLIAPQYYVPSVSTVPVVRVLHDAHPYWDDYQSPARGVFESLYGAENLAVLADEVDLHSWGSGDRDVAMLIQRMYELGADGASGLVTVSRFSADELAHFLPVTAGRWNVAYPYVPSSLAPSGAVAMGGSPAILAVSKLEPRKNQLALISAIDGLRADFPGLSLTLVGGPTASWPDYAELVRAAADASGFVHMIKNASDEQLAGLYSTCDLFVTCSVSEGFGFPGLEALKAGAAVLAGAGTSMPEIYGRRAQYFDESGFRETLGSPPYLAAIAELQSAIKRAVQDVDIVNRSPELPPAGEQFGGIDSTVDSFAAELGAVMERAL